MQCYKFKEKWKRYVLPVIAVHNYQDQIDLEIAWWKWGIYIHLYTK